MVPLARLPTRHLRLSLTLCGLPNVLPSVPHQGGAAMAEHEEQPGPEELDDESTPEDDAAEYRAKRLAELRPRLGSLNAKEKNSYDRLMNEQRIYEAKMEKRWRDQAQGDDAD